MLFFQIIFYLLASFVCHYVDDVNADPVGTGGPATVIEGKDALLTCVVMVPHMNDTVLWKKGTTDILTAGMYRVTSDKRINILHDEAPKGQATSGGDVWVLLIREARASDSGVYTCEVNSEPVLQSLHTLKVKTKNGGTKSTQLYTKAASTAAATFTPSSTSTTTQNQEEDIMTTMPPPITHDFTECCRSMNVSNTCMGFCTVHNIMDGTTGTEAEMCETDFPSIVKCMADGRNHVPCCEKAHIPDLCQDMCRGEYTPFTDFLRSRVTCVAHTIPALNCILEGIQNLPSEPENVFVEPLTEKSLQVTWSPPSKLPETIKYYIINITTLHTFDQDGLPNSSDPSLSINVAGDLESTVISDLKPFTMYSITVSAYNDHGSSLQSYRVRALTLESGVGKQTNVVQIPVLPDVKGCCVKNGMTHRTCIDKMCDPVRADVTSIPDLMVCAPWANITFSCLANNIDHSPCCKSRGIPESCLPLCTGNVKTINYNSFKCLHYMSEYSSCLLQGYGVLAGPPSRLKAPLIADHFAILEWQPPKILPDTVTTYHLHYRKLGSDDEYTVIDKENAPIILEDLESSTYYEAFIVALNIHGKGGPSPRLVFQTKLKPFTEQSSQTYNMTSCCHSYGLLPQCNHLCTYDIKMSELKSADRMCQNQLGVLYKCFAGGRDHTPCCQRRSVTPQCMSACRGIITHNPTDCFSYAGNIIQCFEEGTSNLPGPIEELHATVVTNTSITIAWSQSEDDANNTDSHFIDFLVQYGKVDNMTLYETVVKLDNELNTTDNEMELPNLESNSLYRISVVARGEHGSSLPSSMLLVNTSNADYSNTFGAPSPPHLLNLLMHSATSIQISWQPPEFSHPHDSISYKLYHKSTSADKFSVVETRLLWVRINNLKPNSQHVIYVTASGAKGMSLPSETLVAWTDPALPAFVDPPTIHPSDIIPEGGSMTVLCLALGNPAPTISLYIGGHLVRQDTSRHMVTVIHNVTTDMEQVSCYADNGYGIPMQATTKVSISYSPRIQASGITVASLGDSVDLKCTIKSKPTPKSFFWRDHDGRVPVIQGGNYEMNLVVDKNDPAHFTMTLHIGKLGTADVGDYFCHAENALGSQTRPVSVRIRNQAAVHNISECCVQQNVSTPCMSACSFYVDIDAVIDRPECIVDFDKLMKCAADGSDHRACCAGSDVPRKCLNWCRGEPLGTGGLCALQHTRTIIGCFQANRDRLPGPPQNLLSQVISVDEVLITWDPPMKNPHMVEGYRVFWHDMDPSSDNNFSNTINGLGTSRLDAKETSIRIDGLKQGVMYELVVKAGNHYGASILTEPLRFTLGDHHVTSATHSSNAATVSGMLAGIFAIVLAIAAVLFYKKRKTVHKSANGVAFENPSYLREVNMEHVHIPAVSSDNSSTWRSENLQTPATTTSLDSNSMVPMATEVNPSLYEELKLGHEGAGFKRLVS